MTLCSNSHGISERTACRDLLATARAAPTILNIQVLRGIAALLVVYFHLQPVVHSAYGGNHVWKFGLAGVDIFFVISGFVMFYANRTQPASISRFLAGRVLRVMPLYWCATLLIVALFAIGLRPNGVHYLDAEIVAKSLFLIKRDLSRWPPRSGSQFGMDLDFRDVFLRRLCGIAHHQVR